MLVLLPLNIGCDTEFSDHVTLYISPQASFDSYISKGFILFKFKKWNSILQQTLQSLTFPNWFSRRYERFQKFHDLRLYQKAVFWFQFYPHLLKKLKSECVVMWTKMLRYLPLSHLFLIFWLICYFESYQKPNT